MNTLCRQQKVVREAFGLSQKERLLLDERLSAKSWKSSKGAAGEEDEEKEEEEEEEVTAEELAKLVEEPKLMGRDLRSVVSPEELFVFTLSDCFYPTLLSDESVNALWRS